MQAVWGAIGSFGGFQKHYLLLLSAWIPPSCFSNLGFRRVERRIPMGIPVGVSLGWAPPKMDGFLVVPLKPPVIALE